ncbi:MAG: hypothetical protein AAF960_25980 [Bacteroidota bacterium]
MRIEHLEFRWHRLMRRHRAPSQYIIPLWREIVNAYSNSDRYYHNLHHITNLLSQADKFSPYIRDFDTLELSIWYHDVIYNCLRKDNEEKSAIFAKYRLEAIKYPREKLVKCYEQINATKTHELPETADSDTAWLLDFDLAILSADWSTYQEYTRQIRKEYNIFPNFLYHRGRQKVLKQLLAKDQIYHTNYYHQHFEEAARENMQKELTLLSGKKVRP